jgi:hypothetical protein
VGDQETTVTVVSKALSGAGGGSKAGVGAGDATVRPCWLTTIALVLPHELFLAHELTGLSVVAHELRERVQR